MNQLGDPMTTVALHLFVAEAESRRGVIDSSVEHVRIARSLLEGSPNYWLEGLAAIDSLCLADTRSDPDLAKQESERAVRAAYEAGAEKTKLAAVANSATLALTAGDLDIAERRLHRCSLSQVRRLGGGRRLLMGSAKFTLLVALLVWRLNGSRILPTVRPTLYRTRRFGRDSPRLGHDSPRVTWRVSVRTSRWSFRMLVGSATASCRCGSCFSTPRQPRGNASRRLRSSAFRPPTSSILIPHWNWLLSTAECADC